MGKQQVCKTEEDLVQDKGVPPSGVLNQNAMKIVNKLVGNNAEEAVLEIF